MSRLVKIIDNKYVQIEEYKKSNICFNTNEYDNFEDYCTLRETFDPFEIFYENEKLKKKYENAVADYETTMAENKELKKQVEKALNDYCRLDTYNRTQQKKFIKWLEDKIKQNTPNVKWNHYNEDGFKDYDVENPSCIEVQPTNKVLNEILQKYKEIIGVSDDKK